MRNVEELVRDAAGRNASDIHLVCGLPPVFRLDGRLVACDDAALTPDVCTGFARALLNDRFDELERIGELDLSATLSGYRVRINVFRQQGEYSVALRILRDTIPGIADLGLPPAVVDFPKLQRGLVIVTGETGSGKSTTLSAIINEINHTRCDHILTLEDPIEYVYTPDKCIFNQREIGYDTASYANGLRAALREDPDVVLVGEMRDLETIEIALTAAETGHLVFGTLHTGSAADSIDRIVDVFPAVRQQQIRMQLSMTLKAVLSQQLLPRKDKGRALACEVMLVNHAIKNLIREGKTPQISNTLATSAADGGVTMDNALIQLYKNGDIDREVAIESAHDVAYVRQLLRY